MKKAGLGSQKIPANLLDRILNGDCHKLLKELPDESVDLVISSPPYNIGKPYERKRALDVYLDEQKDVLRECLRLLKETGSIVWQVGSFVDSGRHVPLDIKVFPILESFGMIPRNRIVWARAHGLHAARRFSCRHETLLWFTKSDTYKFLLDPIRVPQKYPQKTSWRGANKGELTGHPLGKNPGDVWTFQNVKHNHEEQTIHPCQFPEDLVERVVLATTEAGDVVLDPYMGAGTVAVVARDLARHFVGFEMDQDYHAVATHRLSGEPDSKGNFPNLKTLRQWAERHEISDLSAFTFTVQVGKVPTGGTRRTQAIAWEAEPEEVAVDDRGKSAFRRGLLSLDGRKRSALNRPRQLPMWERTT